jgi:O-antigen/teichoic acid export membrane protein
MTAAGVGADPSPPRTRSVSDRLLTLGKQTFVYGLAGAASQAVGIVTLPIFARVFSQSEYGVLEVAIVGYAALLVFADTGLTSGAQRSYYDYDDHETSERRAALFTGLAASMALGVVIAVGLMGFATPISRWAFGTAEYDSVVRVVGLTVPVGTLVAFALEAMRLKFKPWRYAVCALISAVGAATIGVVSVVAFDVGVEGVVLGTLAGYGLAAVYGLLVTRRDLLGRFSPPELRKMVAYGLPLLPAAVALWGLNFVDRVMLAKLGSLADTGEYAVANRFALGLTLAVTAFATAFGPFQLALWKEDAELEKRVRNHTLTYLTVALVGLGVVPAVFAREIVSIVAPAFTGAYQVVGLLLMAVTLWGIANLVLFGIGLMRRTGYVALFTLIAALTNIGLNFALIPLWGMIGAGLANLAAYLFLVVLYYHKAQQLYPTDYSLGKPAIVLVAGALTMAVGLLPLDVSVVAYTVKVASVAAFGASLWLLGVIGEAELEELRGVARRARAFRRAEA